MSTPLNMRCRSPSCLPTVHNPFLLARRGSTWTCTWGTVWPAWGPSWMARVREEAPKWGSRATPTRCARSQRSDTCGGSEVGETKVRHLKRQQTEVRGLRRVG